MAKMYIYTLIREFPSGKQGRRKKKLYTFDNRLKIGGLYCHLGSGFPGFQRVLDVTTKEYPD